MEKDYIIELLRIQKDYDLRLQALDEIGIEPIFSPDCQAFLLALNFMGIYQEKNTYYQKFLHSLFHIKVVLESNYTGFIKAAAASFKGPLKDHLIERDTHQQDDKQKDWWLPV